MSTNKDDEISQSLSIILSALKHGPAKLCAVVAHIITISMQQKERIEWLEDQLSIQTVKLQQDSEQDEVFKTPSSEAVEHLKENVRPKTCTFPHQEIHNGTMSYPETNGSSTTRAVSGCQPNEWECPSLTPQTNMEKNELEFHLDNAVAPHPLFGCCCDVCQKLFSIHDVDVYKLETSTVLFPMNCIVKLKNNSIATVSYVGHQRTYKAFINEDLCKIRRPVGITGYIWQQDNEERFFSFEDVDYLFENKARPFPDEVEPPSLETFCKRRHSYVQEKENLAVDARFVAIPSIVCSEVKTSNANGNDADALSRLPLHVTERAYVHSHHLRTPQEREQSYQHIPVTPCLGRIRRHSLHNDCGEGEPRVTCCKPRKVSLSHLDGNERCTSCVRCFERQLLSSDPQCDVCVSAISLGFESSNRGGSGCCNAPRTKPSETDRYYVGQRRGSAPCSILYTGHCPESSADRFCGNGYALNVETRRHY